MPAKTIGTGVLLIAVGAIVSILSESDSITSWIPAFVGGLLVLLGLIAAAKSDLRHHMMHGAAAVALLMVVATLGRMISAGTSGWVAVSQVSSLLICAAYVATAVGSFRTAAAARRLAEKSPESLTTD